MFCLFLTVDEQRLSSSSAVGLPDINSGESPRALLELITSFRKIAGSSPSMDSCDNSPHSSSTDSLSNFTNNWSQSLLKAANVICERITSQQQASNDEKPKMASRNNSKGRLPPLPPLSVSLINRISLIAIFLISKLKTFKYS